MKFMALLYPDMHYTPKALIDKNFSLPTFYQDLSFRTTNQNCVTHRHISDQKNVCSISVGQNPTYFYVHVTIFSRKLVISMIFEVFVKAL